MLEVTAVQLAVLYAEYRGEFARIGKGCSRECPALVVFVDVDDTLVRSAGSKRMPIPSVVSHVKELANANAQLYCWSTAGAEYARATAKELGIEGCFTAFLPKPNIVVDDQDLDEWKCFKVVHPLAAGDKTVEQYWTLLDGD